MSLYNISVLNALAAELHATSRSKGFYDGVDNAAVLADHSTQEEDRTAAAFALLMFEQSRIALMHSELSEALEALRKDPTAPDRHCPEFTNLSIELADAIIRILDYCAYRTIPIAEAIVAKARFNATRPHMHGKTS